MNPIPAVAFLEDFMRPPWTLTAWRDRRGRWIDTKMCRTKLEAMAFLRKHDGRMIRFVLGYAREPIVNEPRPEDVTISCGLALAVPRNKLDLLSPRPSAWIDGPDHGVAAWRYVINVPAGTARANAMKYAVQFAEENGCRADPLPMMMPLPGVGSGFDLVFHRKSAVIDRLSLTPEPRRERLPPPEDQDEKFVRGDQATTGGKGLPMIKKGYIPGEAITLLLGPPKQGKSLFVAKLASYIVSGGSWEPGGWQAGWWDGTHVSPEARGSVIVCEEEDPRLETLARIKAAIGLPEPALSQAMSKVHVRVMVPDISLPAKLKQITNLAEESGDNRMISFSPFSSALKLTAYTEEKVREKIRPIQAWYRDRGIAIIAIVHLDDSGRTSGSKVIPRVCRSGLSFEDGVMTVALSNAGKMGVKVPFRVEETTVTIDNTPIDTGRIVFK